jgi:pyrroline-5-carboxylate reductase
MPDLLIACIGGGNMATALITGSLRAGILKPADWSVAEPEGARRAVLERLGLRTVPRAADLTLGPRTQLLLAIKPQALAEVARDASSLDLKDRVIITILAGTPSERVRAVLGGAGRVVRAMPNLPATLGQGCTAVALGAGALAGDDALALRLFAAVGPVVERVEESLMDAFTSVAGSGPAYLFYLAEAMTRAAVSLGFDPGLADRVVRQVIAGSAAMLNADPERPASDLRAAVTSKGGTTEAACAVLDAARVRDAFLRALTAARDRGRELAQ